METQAKENSKVVNAIASLILGYGFGSYKQAGGKALAQPPSKIGDISVDNVFDIPDEGKISGFCSFLRFLSPMVFVCVYDS